MKFLSYKYFIATFLYILLSGGTTLAATFVVTNTNNSNTGSLRQALIDANATAALDTIIFDIPGPGVHTISITIGYPGITRPLVIDGTTQSGYAGIPLIEIDGSNLSSGQGFYFASGADNSTVKGICVNRFPGRGILAVNMSDFLVESCIIGLDAAGTMKQPNTSFGISCANIVNLTIRDNVIASNGGHQIEIATSSAIVIMDNIVGLDRTGTIALPTTAISKHGISLKTSDDISIVDNVLSGNTGHGLNLAGSNNSTYQNVTIIGNKVGTDITGNLPIGNKGSGLLLSRYTNVTVGGNTLAEQNIIGDNGQYGISATLNDFLVVGNKIGVNAGGNPIGNHQSGIYLLDNAAYIFTNSSIGDGTLAGANSIGNNGTIDVTSDGIYVREINALSIPIIGNHIYDNVQLGIDLQGNGVTFNDAGDIDGEEGQANDYLNFPIINAAMLGSLEVDFDLDVAEGNYRMEVFGIPSGNGDPSGYGEGDTYLGSFIINHLGNGTQNYVETIAGAVDLNAGDSISMTTTLCTDATCTNFVHTSEFSQKSVVTAVVIPEDCTNGIDDDGDGLVDCNDPDCALTIVCCGIPSVNPLQFDGAATVNCEPNNITYLVNLVVQGGTPPYTAIGPGSPGNWTGTNWTSTAIPTNVSYVISITDDLACDTLLIAGTSPTCRVPEDCTNGIDDDGDGLLDCDDPDCALNTPFQLTGTTTINCASNNTAYQVRLRVTGGVAPYTAIGIGATGTWVDTIWTSGLLPLTTNYSIGITDQVACDTFFINGIAPTCALTEDCTNGIDDDGDGLIDCADPDCYKGTNIDNVDTDLDGIANACDLDDDNDGLLDVEECADLANMVEAHSDAYQWTDNGTAIFTISNNTNAAGYQESGFEKAVILDGYTAIPLENDFTKNVRAIDFTGGTVTLNATGFREGAITLVESTLPNFISGESGDGINVQLIGLVQAGATFNVAITFTTPVTYFSFDWVDLFDAGSDLERTRYAVLADGQLLAYLEGNRLGPSGVGMVQLYNAMGDLVGDVTVGENIETTFGFITPTPITTYTLRHDFLTRVTASDWHGIDNFTFKTALICDFDGDGQSNHLDTDADADGCIDAIEGGGNFTSTDVDGNDRLSGGVGDDGIPIALVTPQSIGLSQYTEVLITQKEPPIDTICSNTFSIDTLVINKELAAENYTWFTENGATIRVLPGDTIAVVDWSTSRINDGLDAVCIRLSNSCEADTLCLSAYLKTCTICDPADIDLCAITRNSPLQATYHAQIIKTATGYLISGQNLAPDGASNQSLLTAIPSADYPMPAGVLPVFGAIAARSQAVFLASDGLIYAVGHENYLIDGTVTAGTAWQATTLTLPRGISVCDVVKWEGTGNADSEGLITNGHLVFMTANGQLYITANDGIKMESTATNPAIFTPISLPAGITAVDYAVAYNTLLVLGNDGQLYASGPTTYMGAGNSTINVDALTLLTNQPPSSIGGIVQIEAGANGAYYALDADGTIHVVGDNTYGQLGIGSTVEQTTWTKVGAGTCTGVLTDVINISATGTNSAWQSASAVLSDNTLNSWGSNSNNAITSSTEATVNCPSVPCGAPMNVYYVSNGGHITPIMDINLNICNVGHNADGAFGDGTATNRNCYECNLLPGDPIVCIPPEERAADCVVVGNDADNDGVPDIVDIDADNDGITNIIEGTIDTDLDGIPNYLDLDSDNDGIPDAIEACGNISLVLENCRLDANGDAIYPDNNLDECPDGLVSTACSTAPLDTDGDSTPDFLDLDSDGDGCADAFEVGSDGNNVNTDTLLYNSPAALVDTAGLVLNGVLPTCQIPMDISWRSAVSLMACCETEKPVWGN